MCITAAAASSTWANGTLPACSFSTTALDRMRVSMNLREQYRQSLQYGQSSQSANQQHQTHEGAIKFTLDFCAGRTWRMLLIMPLMPNFAAAYCGAPLWSM